MNFGLEIILLIEANDGLHDFLALIGFASHNQLTQVINLGLVLFN